MKELSGLQARWCSNLVQSGKPLLIIAEDHRRASTRPRSSSQVARRPEDRAVEKPPCSAIAASDAGGHCHPHRRPGHLRGPRHQAGKCHAADAGPGKEDRHSEKETTASSTARERSAIDGRVAQRYEAQIEETTPTMIARSCRSGWPSSPAASPVIRGRRRHEV